MTHEPNPDFALLTATDERRRRAETKALDVSLNELADMYSSGELFINPNFQRLFRWEEEKESQFVESLLLEMPVPPIYCMEDEEGRWELIDGLQRVSSYLHYRGLLTAQHRGIADGDRLRLVECDIVPELNGFTFDDLPAALRIRLKRAFLRVELIRSSTDVRFKYYMFKRLNTGGEILSNQEVRNCTIRLLDDTFNEFIIRLSKKVEFQDCIGTLSDDARERMTDVELVLRFFAFKNNFTEFRHDVGPFLDEYMERVSDVHSDRAMEFHYQSEEQTFDAIFGLLRQALGESTCQKYLHGQPSGGFSNHHFEAFTLGLARALGERPDAIDHPDLVSMGLRNAKSDPGLTVLTTGGGKNSPGPYNAKIEAVASHLRAVL